MPKIKIYKGNNAIIAVAQAKVATGYQCKRDGTLFSNKRDFVKHLRAVRSNVHFKIRYNNKQRNFAKSLEDLSNQHTFDDIIAWVENNPKFFLDRIIHTIPDWKKKYPNIYDEFSVMITYLDVSYSDSVSNTHSAPRSGVQNWPGDSSKPRGYPGWSGRIEYKVSHPLGFGSDMFHGIGINTGSGGGRGNGQYGYYVKFFAADWIGLEKAKAFDILKGEPPKKCIYGIPKYFR